MNDIKHDLQFLRQALPLLKQYLGEKIIIKYGGHVMGDKSTERSFAEDVALLRKLGLQIILVHGGGPQIDIMLEKTGVVPRFEGGLRVTDEKTLEIAEMVLSGTINKAMASLLTQCGVTAVGLSGRDSNMAIAEKVYKTAIDSETGREAVLDLGLVGEIAHFDTTLLNLMLKNEIVPVLASIAADKEGNVYNVNSDSFAGALAAAYQAKRLVFLTDAPGVLDENGKLISRLTVSQARRLMQNGVITGGMLPKIENCIDALDAGVSAVVIVSGKLQHALIYELFSRQGIGTVIVAD